MNLGGALPQSMQIYLLCVESGAAWGVERAGGRASRGAPAKSQALTIKSCVIGCRKHTRSSEKKSSLEMQRERLIFLLYMCTRAYDIMVQ